MKNQSIFQEFISGWDKAAQAQLAFHFHKQMMVEEFAKSKEIQKMKAEITQDVLDCVSVSVENKVRQTLDELFKEFNV